MNSIVNGFEHVENPIIEDKWLKTKKICYKNNYSTSRCKTTQCHARMHGKSSWEKFLLTLICMTRTWWLIRKIFAQINVHVESHGSPCDL
jgi:hypothetical protein